MRLLAFVVTLVLACAVQARGVRAQDMQDMTMAPSPEAAAEPEAPALTCEEKWGCWDLLLSTQGAVLGTKITLTHVGGSGPRKLDAGFSAVYQSEHHATFEHLTVHLAMAGALGGGTAGNERLVLLQPDFGWRADMTPKGGPFLRAGSSLFLFGHNELYLSMFEPLRAIAGYQVLDGKLLIEAGMTQGLVALGSYHTASDRSRTLSQATELGGYATARIGFMRGSASFTHIYPESKDRRSDVDLLRSAVCSYAFAATICGDALYVRGDAGGFGNRDRFRHSVYFGITVGLSP